MPIAVDVSNGKRGLFANTRHDQLQHRQQQVSTIQETPTLNPSRPETHLRHYRRQSRLGAKDIGALQLRQPQKTLESASSDLCKEQHAPLVHRNPIPEMLVSIDPSSDDNGDLLADLAIVPTFLCKYAYSLLSLTKVGTM